MTSTHASATHFSAGLGACLAIAITPLGCRTQASLDIVSRAPRHIEVDGGTSVVSYELALRQAADLPERALMFYVQGSSYESVMRSVPRLAGPLALGMPVVVAERRGINAEGIVDRDSALRGSTRELRIRDQLAVLRAYLEGRRLDLPVVVMGGSEGGDIAAAVAARHPRVTHLVIIGTGCGWSQSRELRDLLRTGVQFGSTRSEAELDLMFARIRSAPDSLEQWAGHPFRRWSSYLWKPAIDELLTLDIPILLIHGSLDTNVPVASARAAKSIMVAAGKTNLSYREHPALDHTLYHEARGVSGFPLIEQDVVEWLAATGVIDDATESMALRRIRNSHPELFQPEAEAGDGKK